MSQPSTYTPEKADAICERIGEGEPLRVICRDPGMPSWRTVYRWIEADEEFAARIAHARTRGFDAIAEQCLDIADDRSNDTKVIETEDGGREVANTEWISRSKLRVETRLKLLAKWDPKRYGDKLDLNHSGRVVHASEMTDDELLRLAAGSGG